MSRAGYSDDIDDNWQLICWRGAVKSAIRGKRGQEFLRRMLAALDALPSKRLIAHELEKDGDVCALGSVARVQGMDVSAIDPGDYDAVASAFGIPQALVREIEYVNDEYLDHLPSSPETEESRFQTVREWVVDHLIKPEAA
jgi:hypothetical protein